MNNITRGYTVSRGGCSASEGFNQMRNLCLCDGHDVFISSGGLYDQLPPTSARIARLLEKEVRAIKCAGDYLGNEKSLMARFGAGRATLRQALRILEANYLVEVRSGPRGGLYSLGDNFDGAIRLIGGYILLAGVPRRAVMALLSHMLGAAAPGLAQTDACLHQPMALQHWYKCILIPALAESPSRHLEVLCKGLYWALDAQSPTRDIFVLPDTQCSPDGMIFTSVGKMQDSTEPVRQQPRWRPAFPAEGANTRIKLSTHVVRAIHAMTLAPEMSPDDKLGTIASLAREIGVSEDIFREALYMLTIHGVVTVRPGRGGGIFVGRISPRHLLQGLGTFLKPEPEAVVLLARHIANRPLEDDARELCDLLLSALANVNGKGGLGS